MLHSDNIGLLYEIGLAHANKTSKKETGTYYTPKDVAAIMAEYFEELSGENICDVCCGTGNLLLAVLRNMGPEKAKQLLLNGNVFIYDADPLAVKICRKLISITYGNDAERAVKGHIGDFLSKQIVIPPKSKVISNPPYFKITTMPDDWEITPVIKESRDFYPAIMEKIFEQSESSVIITPYSFMGGDKFSELRRKMSALSGEIFAFDNVPGNIFNGRKNGQFNSNTTNSVRAAITVTRTDTEKGYRCSYLIRFKNEERETILSKRFLDNSLGAERQVVIDKEKFIKCAPSLEQLLKSWKMTSGDETLNDLLSADGKYKLCVPNTCRYFTVASFRDLRRTGKNTIGFDSPEKQAFAYCLINSSFCYWHWRLYDGGITYPISLLKSLPTFYTNLTEENKQWFLAKANEMKYAETSYLAYKKNAGEEQENIKFPEEYINSINNYLLEILNRNLKTNYKSEIFKIVHTNKAVY